MQIQFTYLCNFFEQKKGGVIPDVFCESKGNPVNVSLFLLIHSFFADQCGWNVCTLVEFEAIKESKLIIWLTKIGNIYSKIASDKQTFLAISSDVDR